MKVGSPISDVLRQVVRDSGVALKALERETGVQRASLSRFLAGRQSLRLDAADRLAAYFGLRLLRPEKKGK
jgi:plasmid maintenance system antidote protein VapI